MICCRRRIITIGNIGQIAQYIDFNLSTGRYPIGSKSCKDEVGQGAMVVVAACIGQARYSCVVTTCGALIETIVDA